MFWLAPFARGISSSNSPVRRIARRHMTRGQRAMAVAMVYPEPSKSGRGGNKGLRGATDVEKSRLSRARTVLRHSADLAKRGVPKKN
jgi:dienelactone hydrolase